MTKKQSLGSPHMGESEEYSMTFRQWCAGRVLTKLMGDSGYYNSEWPGNITKESVRVSDALMKALEGKQ